MSDTLYIKLPFPPSLNTYWRNIVVKGRSRTLLSQRGREYRTRVLAAVCFDDMVRPAMEGRLEVHLEVCAPDRRRRDLDNIPKAVLDCLEHANVFRDDSQVDELHIVRGEVGKPGHVMVTITEK
jgi:crossover junction endodeoxyribonuclease RusA